MATTWGSQRFFSGCSLRCPSARARPLQAPSVGAMCAQMGLLWQRLSRQSLPHGLPALFPFPGALQPFTRTSYRTCRAPGKTEVENLRTPRRRQPETKHGATWVWGPLFTFLQPGGCSLSLPRRLLSSAAPPGVSLWVPLSTQTARPRRRQRPWSPRRRPLNSSASSFATLQVSLTQKVATLSFLHRRSSEHPAKSLTSCAGCSSGNPLLSQPSGHARQGHCRAHGPACAISTCVLLSRDGQAVRVTSARTEKETLATAEDNEAGCESKRKRLATVSWPQRWNPGMQADERTWGRPLSPCISRERRCGVKCPNGPTPFLFPPMWIRFSVIYTQKTSLLHLPTLTFCSSSFQFYSLGISAINTKFKQY